MSSKLKGSLKHKHLVLCFDAFGTLFKPRIPIQTTYANCARRYGIKDIDEEALAVSFKKAFKIAYKGFPNYGKATGLTPEMWWARVIRESFEPVTSTYIPDVMIHALMKQFSSNQAYRLFGDVRPLFRFLEATRSSRPIEESVIDWPWKSTTVGVITNSDPRVPQILGSLGLSVRQSNRVMGPGQEGPFDINFVTMSYNVGIEKPDVQIFRAAEMAFSQLLSPGRITEANVVKVHVGDDMEKDTFGAIDAGWDAIFLDREGRFRDEWKTAGSEEKTLSVTEKGRKFTIIKDLGALELCGRGFTALREASF